MRKQTFKLLFCLVFIVVPFIYVSAQEKNISTLELGKIETEGNLSEVVWQPGGNFVVESEVLAEPGKINIWNAETLSLIDTINLDTTLEEPFITWTKDGKKFAVGYADPIDGKSNNIYIFAIDGEEILLEQSLRHAATSSFGTQLFWNLDGDRLLSFRKSEDNHSIIIWDVHSGEKVFENENALDEVTAMEWNSQENYLILGLNTGEVEIWDISEESPLILLPKDSTLWGPITQVVQVENTDYIIGTGYNGAYGMIWKWDLASQNLISSIGTDYARGINDILVFPDLKLLISSGFQDSTIYFWDIGSEISLIDTLEMSENVISLSGEVVGRNLAVGLSNGQIILLTIERL